MVKRIIAGFFALLLILTPCLSFSAQGAHGGFYDEGPEIKDFDYSIVFVPDTQVITYWYPEELHHIYDWIIDNKEEKKIGFVVGLGDMTEKSLYMEWDVVRQQVNRLNGIVPYALVRGNHDKTIDFNKFFPKKDTPHIEGTYDGWINNSWRTIRLGQLDYLILTLDYGAEDDVLTWASGIIESHPKHNVIIATHSYLFNDGTTLDAEDDCPPSLSGGYNDGDDMWDKLIKKHENIVLVVCGHDASDRIVVRRDIGEHGNTVTQMLIDAQNLDRDIKGTTGMVAVAYFSNAGRNVQIEYYSTVRNQWFMDENQFSMKLDTIPAAADNANEPSLLPIIIAVIASVMIVIAAVTVIIIKKTRKETV